MILESLLVDRAEFERGTGWAIRPEGACKDDRCVPLSGPAPTAGGARLDVPMIAGRLVMPLVHDETSGLWCLGPEVGGRALAGAHAPDLILSPLPSTPTPARRGATSIGRSPSTPR